MAKERKCPHCGKNTRTTGDFCPWCSLPMVTTPDDNESVEPETGTENLVVLRPKERK